MLPALRLAGLAVSLVLISACTSNPPLELPPPEFQLGGTWWLVPELSENAPNLRRSLNADLPRPDGGPPQRRAIASGNLAFLLHDLPVLQATRMDIEQNRDSMGIAYDGGIYRDISWGERDRGLWQIRTGWIDQALVIYSKASDVKTTERMTLQNNLLRILISVDGKTRDFQIERVYERR